MSLNSCATDTVVDLTAPSFIDQPVYRINVANVRLNDQFQPTFEGKHVEHQFPTSPARAVGIWTNDRLQAAGNQGVMEVIIRDASVVETPGKKFDRFDAVLAVDLKLYDGIHPLPLAEANSQVTQSRSIKNTASITKREDLFAQMTRDLMKSLDASLDSNLRQYFGQHIVSLSNP
ncbi:MAG: hypothetical protein K2Q12_09480 [Rickettsiales bacterium]|nr:hypothetical protein [Rickettsiales bacterium]